MKRYQRIASLIEAMDNCRKSNNEEWLEKHCKEIERIVKDELPSGSGIDNGTHIDLDASTSEKLVFDFGYHHMNENGMYSGWTEHKLIVKPSLAFGCTLKITGSNRNEIKDYLYETYDYSLKEEVKQI